MFEGSKARELSIILTGCHRERMMLLQLPVSWGIVESLSQAQERLEGRRGVPRREGEGAQRKTGC